MDDPHTANDRGPWMITFSGRAFYPACPRADEVALVDIAHGLAHTCRYGGHVQSYYSVAEHCVLMWEAARDQGQPIDVQRAALMHDAAEAYVLDIPRPLKLLLGEAYRKIEREVEQAVCFRFQLPALDHPWVKDADNRILADERAALLAPCPPGLTWTTREPLGVQIRAWTPEAAKLAFLGAAMAVGLT